MRYYQLLEWTLQEETSDSDETQTMDTIEYIHLPRAEPDNMIEEEESEQDRMARIFRENFFHIVHGEFM